MEKEIMVIGLVNDSDGAILGRSFVLSRDSLSKGGMRLNKDDSLLNGGYPLLILKYEEFLEDEQTRAIQERRIYVSEEMYKDLKEFLR